MEHAVTELVTGIDMVKWQIRIAAGVHLDFGQADIRFRGSSIECRINAKASGKVNFLHIPGGPFVRFDTCLWDGYVVPPYYDSLLGKMCIRDRYSGMGQSLSQASPAAHAVFEAVDAIRPGTSQQCFTGSKEDLSITSNTQPCMFAVELAAARALEEAGICLLYTSRCV